ncbi:hypothetical protein OYC64_008045 [Pagothenia borchgrevinki]|uniref:Uncharacterized protein n=1 Tax=Pagothenia borchgrevinki TaxID=8213 RepID=A0ABD2GU35_PAGBO
MNSMGISVSKEMRQSEKHPYNKDTQNETSKEETAKEENDLSGDLSSSANTSQVPSQLHQMDPSRGAEAMLSWMQQFPAYALPNGEQSKAKNISQDADPVKYIPFISKADPVTQQHTSLAEPKDSKTNALNWIEALKKGLALRLGLLGTLCPQQSRPSESQVKRTKPVQHRGNRPVVFGETHHNESTAKEITAVPLHTAPASSQVTPPMEWSFGSKEPTDIPLQVPDAKKPEPVQRIYKRVVRRLLTANLQSKKAVAQTETEISQSAAQKSSSFGSRVNTGSSELQCPATGQKQAEAQVDKKEKEANSKSVTEEEEDLKYRLGVNSERSRAVAANMRLRRKLVKKKELDGVRCNQKAAGSAVNPLQESSQQQAVEGNTTKTHNKKTNPNRNTLIQNKKTNAQALKVPGVEGTAATHNPTTAAPETSTGLQQEPQDPAIKPKNRCKAVKNIKRNHTGKVPEKEKHGDTKGDVNGEKYQVQTEEQKAAIPSEAAPGPVRTGGRWPPFTVNQSCSHKVRCHQGDRFAIKCPEVVL